MSENQAGEPMSLGPRGGRRAGDEIVLRFEGGVDLSRIRTALGQARERAGAPVERVLTVNFVATHFSQLSWERAQEPLAAATALHPARVVVLIADPKTVQEGVTASVSVVRPAGAAHMVERVVLTATGASVRHLESAMQGLLVPEVPFVLIWGGRPEGDLLRRAAEQADRVIIDSGSRGAELLPHVRALLQRGAPLGDLAWARIFPWQVLAAEVLDVPNLREHRGHIQAARVHCAGAPAAEAALLAGWFQSRVKRAKVDLVAGPAQAGAAADGQVVRLEFEAPPARFSLAPAGGVLEALVEGDDDGGVLHRVRLPPDQAGRLLGLELKLLHGRDETYAAAVDQAVRLLAAAAPASVAP